MYLPAYSWLRVSECKLQIGHRAVGCGSSRWLVSDRQELANYQISILLSLFLSIYKPVIPIVIRERESIVALLLICWSSTKAAFEFNGLMSSSNDSHAIHHLSPFYICAFVCALPSVDIYSIINECLMNRTSSRERKRERNEWQLIEFSPTATTNWHCWFNYLWTVFIEHSISAF